MSGRCVLITGSSRGIGLGIARAFAENGDRVVLNARADAETLTQAVDTLKTEYPQASVLGLLADMSDEGAARDCFRQVKAMFGDTDVLVNNAGDAHFGLFSDMTGSEIDRVLRNNLYSTLYACKQAVPAMVHAKNGVIINISSVWGVSGASCEAVYAAAKGAVNIFTKSLAKELGPSGVRVNAIACGAFETRMNARLSTEEKSDFIDGIPLGRFGNAAEAGDLAVFLASEQARYLTGQIIALDGGFL